MDTAKKKQMPVLEGAWTKASSVKEKLQLIGSECSFCGEIYFPKKSRKINENPDATNAYTLYNPYSRKVSNASDTTA